MILANNEFNSNIGPSGGAFHIMSPNFQDEVVEKKKLNEETMRNAFEEMDIDGDGWLTLGNLEHFFNHTLEVVSNTDYIVALMAKHEMRDDRGRIDYDEFKAIFIENTDLKPFVVIHNNKFEKNMAYFAGNAFHITSTLSFTVDFDDYL